jgi:two-component system phosphate regulon sensor histidine kinase PhoR
LQIANWKTSTSELPFAICNLQSAICNGDSMFWRVLGLYAVLWLVSAAVLGLVIAGRIEQGDPESLRRLVLTAVAATALTAVLVALWVARRLAKPLRDIARAAERIAGGNSGHKIYVAAPEEIAALARAFNHMSEQLALQFAQLEEDRQQLRTILSGMVEGVVALDGERRILFANERAGELLDFQPQAAVGRKLSEVVRHSALSDVATRVQRSAGPFRQELDANGPTTRSLTVHAARLPGPGTRSAVLVLHDTTELRRLERMRQDFVANVSHELKTPLSIIKAYVETLLDGAADDPEARGPFLEKIANQTERLHNLILDLLSLARIEAGTEVFEFRAVAMEPVISACLERHRARAEGKQQVLEAVPPEGERDVAAWADEEAVNEMLDNLVDNALKYTPAGGRVCIQWSTRWDHVALVVEDTGIGIPERDLPRIFERFYRVDKARSRELGGTGLGLAIVKHLAQAMRGSVRASSRLGQGSTFTVLLPRADRRE